MTIDNIVMIVTLPKIPVTNSTQSTPEGFYYF